jgi:hypothetical protein
MMLFIGSPGALREAFATTFELRLFFPFPSGQ